MNSWDAERERLRREREQGESLNGLPVAPFILADDPSAPPVDGGRVRKWFDAPIIPKEAFTTGEGPALEIVGWEYDHDQERLVPQMAPINNETAP